MNHLTYLPFSLIFFTILHANVGAIETDIGLCQRSFHLILGTQSDLRNMSVAKALYLFDLTMEQAKMCAQVWKEQGYCEPLNTDCFEPGVMDLGNKGCTVLGEEPKYVFAKWGSFAGGVTPDGYKRLESVKFYKSPDCKDEVPKDGAVLEVGEEIVLGEGEQIRSLEFKVKK